MYAIRSYYASRSRPPDPVPAIAALLDSRSGLQQLRRAFRPPGHRVITCRSPAALERLGAVRLLDAVVLGPRVMERVRLADRRERFPTIPNAAYGLV